MSASRSCSALRFTGAACIRTLTRDSWLRAVPGQTEMAHSFVIDSLPESAARYRDTHALAVVDVFRATTCIVTALFRGHAVYPVATIGEAVTVAGRLRDARPAGGRAPGTLPT